MAWTGTILIVTELLVGRPEMAAVTKSELEEVGTGMLSLVLDLVPEAVGRVLFGAGVAFLSLALAGDRVCASAAGVGVSGRGACG